MQLVLSGSKEKCVSVTCENTAKMTHIKMFLFSYQCSATQDIELNEEKLDAFKCKCTKLHKQFSNAYSLFQYFGHAVYRSKHVFSLLLLTFQAMHIIQRHTAWSVEFSSSPLLSVPSYLISEIVWIF